MLKSVFQSLIVVLRISIKEYNEVIHGVLFTILMILLIIFKFFKPAYNYGRVNVLSAMSIMCVGYLSFLSTLSHIIVWDDYNSWTITLLIGWMVIIVVMLVIMYRKHK